MSKRFLLVSTLLAVLSLGARSSAQSPRLAASACPGTRSRAVLGLGGRPLTLREIVERLEQGCLALQEVRFRAGQDTIESLSPAQFALLARALGMAHGSYRVTVPPEASPGWPPDTVQARRRGTRLRDELVHYGASLERLREDSEWALPPVVAVRGAAIPMLVRVPMP